MVRTPTAQQRILLSPQVTTDAANATVTISSSNVDLVGNLNTTGTVVSANMDSTSLRLRRAGAAGSPGEAAQQLRILAATGTALSPYDADVYMLNGAQYTLAATGAINGRRLTLRNVYTATLDAIVTIQRLDGTTARTLLVPPGGTADLYGYLDMWA
jgi:hypothetical protein